MDAGAVNNWEAGIFFIEGQCKIGPSKHDRLGSIFIEQPLTDNVEDLALRLRHNASRRHVNVCLMDIFQVLPVGRDDLRRRYATVETCFHRCAGSADTNAHEAALRKASVDFGTHADKGNSS